MYHTYWAPSVEHRASHQHVTLAVDDPPIAESTKLRRRSVCRTISTALQSQGATAFEIGRHTGRTSPS